MAFSLLKKSAVEGAPKMYSYTAVSADGVRRKNRMQAPSKSVVSATLEEKGYYLLDIKEIDEAGLSMDLGAAWSARPLRMKPVELSAFTRQLYQLIRSGISMPKAIATMGEEAEPRMAAMCQDISERVSNGATMSDAFAAYPTVFDDIFIAYISAGEITGAFLDTLYRLSRMLEKRAMLANKIKSVTAYPKMVSGAIGAMVVLIFLFLVPMYADIYASLGSELPAPTRIVVAISEQLVPISFHHVTSIIYIPYPNFLSPTLWIGLLIFAAMMFLRATKNDLEIGKKIDKLKFGMPIFGRLNYKTSLFRWSSTLAGALHTGVQQQPALELAARASGSRWQRLVTAEHIERVRSGKALSESLTNHRELYPPNVRAMVATGEISGDMAEMLESVATAIDDEIDTLVSGLSAKIEVGLLMIMGVVVGLLLIALYLPILNLATTAGEGLSGGEF